MKVTQKKLDDGRLQLEAVAEPAEVNKALYIASVQFARQMGLRPGKDNDVQKAAEAQMGIKDLDSVVENEAIDYLAPYALDKKGIIPAFPPSPLPSSPLKRDKPFSFRIFVTPKPDYELENYEPVKVKVQKFVPDLSKVDNDLAEMAERYAMYQKVEGDTLKEGGSALIAIDATCNGEPLNGLNSDGRTYTAGEGFMPSGFDEQVIGMKVGETKTFTFEGPNFDADGNDTVDVVECTVTVLEIQDKALPQIDDEWVQTYMPMYHTVEEMRADMERSYTEQQKAAYEDYVDSLCHAELAKRFKGRIDDATYEATSKSMISDMRRNVQAQNMTWEQFVEEQGGEQQFNMMCMIEVRNNLVQGYALDCVFRHFGLVLSPEDVEGCCKKMSPRNPSAFRDEMEKNGRNFALREAAERYKASKYLREHAEISYYEDKAEDAEAEEAPAVEEAAAAEESAE